MNGALALTFDIDAESVWLAESRAYSSRLTTLSEARYGTGRGLRRILDLLAANDVLATFYIPGATAEAHPDAVEMIMEGGHAIGHHGHDHLKTHAVDRDIEQREIEKGLAALQRFGIRPCGYRSPAWELTPTTLELLPKYGFTWDSSLMEDDRPYSLTAGDASLVELPVHWSLDDWPRFGWTEERGGQLADVDAVIREWEIELRVAAAEDRPLTVTMHPEVIGRPHRLVVVERMIDAARSARVDTVTHSDLTAEMQGALGPG